MPNIQIPFNEIPFDWVKPGVMVEIRPNYSRRGVLPFEPRPLLIVQKLAAGTAIALQRYEITDDFTPRVLFGVGSVGHEMCLAFRRANKTSRLTVMAMDDAGGATVATCTATITGAATSNATLSLYIAGNAVPITVTTTMTPTQIAAAIVAAVAANTALPVTAAAVAGVVTFTSKNRGALVNDIDIRLNRFQSELTPPGITVVITAMAGGATNPTLQTALDAIAAEWYTDIAVPWTDAPNVTALAADLAARYRAMGRRDAHGYSAVRGTYGQLITFSASSNSPFYSVMGARTPFSETWEIAASLCGVASFQLANDPARQLRTLELPGINMDPATAFTETEQDLLLRAGISTWNRVQDGGVTVIDRVVTLYKTSNLNVPDTAWRDIMVAKTASRIRWDWANYISLLYPRHKLTDDDSPAANNNDAVVTPRRMHASWAGRCTLYEEQGWIVDVQRTVQESKFQINASDRNRMDALQQISIIGNLMVLAAALEFQV